MMIGYFPTPYPDELFHSVCARFAHHLGVEYNHSAITNLFGEGKFAVGIDLPNRLHDFVSRLPNNHFLTQEEIIKSHTLYPIYIPFLDKPRLIKVVDAMVASSGVPPRSLIGANTVGKLVSRQFGYCLSCVEEDRDAYGETYWHRVHQIRGVNVCPKHEIQLKYTSIKKLNNIYELYPAERYITPVSPVALTHDSGQCVLEVAKDIEWLLASDSHSISTHDVKRTYYYLLSRKGFAKKNGERISLLQKSLVQYLNDSGISSRFEKIGLPPKLKFDHSWVRELVNLSVGKNPLIHLTFIRELGASIQDVPSLHNKAIRWEFGSRRQKSGNVISHAVQHENKEYTQAFLTRRQTYRSRMLKSITEVPSIRRTDLNSRYSAEYSWLYKNDKEWFEQNMPARKSTGGNKITVDWEGRDDELQSQLESTYLATLGKNARPVRITKTRLIKDAELGYNPYRAPEKLPKTMSFLEEASETSEQLALRRIAWAEDYCASNGIKPTRTKFIYEIAKVDEWIKIGEVEQRVQNALATVGTLYKSTLFQKTY